MSYKTQLVYNTCLISTEGRQIREMSDKEFQTKIKGLQRNGVPYFTAISKRVEKLRETILHYLQDDRKCRSKAVQKVRFEIGKVLGMSEGLLYSVFQE